MEGRERERERDCCYTGHMARDENAGMGVENTTLEIPGDVYESMYRLERYDKGEDYTIRG